MRAETGALIAAASRPYLAGGLSSYCFVRAKLTHDPVFLALLRSGRLPDRARVLDLGCNHAIFAALVLAARERFERGLWPSSWAAPPGNLQLHGIEFERRIAQRARLALGERATIQVADLRDAPLPQADVVMLIDVLHYLDKPEQLSLLERIAHCLHENGLLVLRVADSAAGWRFEFGKAGDRLGALPSIRAFAKQHHRPLQEWLEVLHSLGFQPSVEPGAGRSFANALVWAQASAHA